LGANLGGFGSAMGRGGHQIGQLLRGVIGEVRPPSPGAHSSLMGFDQLLVKKDPDQVAAASGPNLSADEPGGQGVVGAVKDDMVIGMDGTLFPKRAFKSLPGERLQTGRLFLLENLKGASFCRPMD